MSDHAKSKAELIEELESLRGAVGVLEARLRELEARSRTPARTMDIGDRQRREALDARVEFIADFDVLEAIGLNISEGGISFEMYEDLPFEMRFEGEGHVRHHRAHLIWVKRLATGGYQFGLRFSDESDADPNF